MKIVDGKLYLPFRQTRYTPDPGEVPANTEVFCGICKSKCEERRNIDGPRGFVQAMGRGTSLHDAWHCPHINDDWHEQAERLLEMANATPSVFLEKTFVGEAFDIIDKKKPTKKWNRYV